MLRYEVIYKSKGVVERNPFNNYHAAKSWAVGLKGEWAIIDRCNENKILFSYLNVRPFVVQLIRDLFEDGREHDTTETGELLAKHGFSPKSASPVLTTLSHVGYLNRITQGCYQKAA